MLEIKGLTKYYRNVPVVNDVTFSVHPGEVTGYLGPNGSGKSRRSKLSPRSSSRAAEESSSTARTSGKISWPSSVV
jgi:ABC-type Mn2+/Zn2+ transport system ATPase subunit